MAIPDFQEMMNPVLSIYEKSGTGIRPRDIEDRIATIFNLSDEEQRQMIPSNIETVLRNRVSWAVYYLEQDCLIDQKEVITKLVKQV